LKGVAIAARHQHTSFASPLCGDRRSKKVIGFVTRCLGVGKPAGCDEVRESVQLFEQRIVEVPSALISRKLPMPVSQDIECVPGDEHGARAFGLIEP